MTVLIKHHYKNNKIWEDQNFRYDNVYKIETEFQPQNGNSYWLKLYVDNGQIKYFEYFEIDTDPNCYDTIKII